MTGLLKFLLTITGLAIIAWALLVLLRPEEDFDESSDWDWFSDTDWDDWTEGQFQYLFDDHGREP